jgi:hypothetical protein
VLNFAGSPIHPPLGALKYSVCGYTYNIWRGCNISFDYNDIHHIKCDEQKLHLISLVSHDGLVMGACDIRVCHLGPSCVS